MNFHRSAPTSINPCRAEEVDLSVDDHVFTIDVDELHVGTGGDIKVDMQDGATVVFKSVQAGRFHARIAKVYKASTTAVDLVGLAFL